ncbi:cytoplasmic protein [Kwoniella heveanensis BCC8398]|uniref:Cytoplasmic protein n=1 Tax=Kwoniella heveanensis BCC8398 TaxID=1296120 RepID=A0A1B9GN22_9TREE|nr:cytoplasmic protein [Kwoniella heveanensis BCC8398]
MTQHNNNNNNNSLLGIFVSLLKICCGSSQEPSAPQQGQQQQQQQGYQGGYPGQGYGVNQQQQAYPPQGQPTWAGVAGGQQHQQQYPPQGYHQQQQQQQQQSYHLQQQQQPYHQQQQQHQGWNQTNNGHGPSKPHSPPGGSVVGPHHPGQNQDQINATNEHYQELRNRARREGDEAHRCFAESQQAYQSGDGARAHDLSVQGKEHQRKQDELDDQAGAWIFNENNKASPDGTIDLHGLYVKEAIERTEAAITSAQREGRDELRVIVGKGLHSVGGKAKIKPAVEDLMRKYNLSARLDEDNAGVLIVDLQGRGGHGRSRDAGGLVDDLDKDDQGCRIM